MRAGYLIVCVTVLVLLVSPVTVAHMGEHDESDTHDDDTMTGQAGASIGSLFVAGGVGMLVAVALVHLLRQRDIL